MKNQKNWSNFSTEAANIIFFWGFCVAYFFVFRLAFLLIYFDQVNEQTAAIEFLKTFAMGFRFDATVTSYFILFPFLSLLILFPFNKLYITKYLRRFFQGFFILSTTTICIITISYFREYNNQFNHFLFVGLYDDQKAVLQTIVADFNPIINLSALLIIMVICYFIFKYFENKTFLAQQFKRIQAVPYRTIFFLILIMLFIGSIRGSFGVRPAMRKWSSISSDSFLNKTIINPFRSLNYAISDFNKLNKNRGINPFGVVSNNIEGADISTITTILEKSSQGNIIEKPKHIFLIVMESYDSWPLLDKYSEFGIANRLGDIAKKGVHFNNFLPASATTMNSFGAIIVGVPYAGINISKIGAINKPFVSSLFNQFKQLGYETNFFYGGFLSWQNIGNLVKNQGADNLYSAANAGGKTESGVWGIDDDKLFELVLNTVDKNRNSLNVILTTSYHPPYTIDLHEKGFPYKTKSDLPSKVLQLYTEAMPLKALGHLWYSDKAIGDFVSLAENTFDKPLFCFTGDHYGRRFINHNPNLYEKSSVPFILYGLDLESKLNDTPGSHIDIIPTLIEMIAPKNFKYYSFGNSLFLESENKFGIAYRKIISKKELQHFSEYSKIQNYNLANGNTSFISKSAYESEYRKMLSLAWHYVANGDSIPQ